MTIFVGDAPFVGRKPDDAFCKNASADTTGVPVSRALMSGLFCGVRRRPSWVFACVSGAYLVRVLESHDL
jgi:hypothetical protein